ncbi:aminotransferase class IV [Urechidicola sp. KH5]
MININGQLFTDKQAVYGVQNRAFKYGDAVFETVKLFRGKLVFAEDHYFRLMASLRMLRMDIPMHFTLEYFEEELLKTAKASNLEIDARLRITVCRKEGGLYTPKNNGIDFAIEVGELSSIPKDSYEVELYKDFYVYSGLLSTLKTTNKVLNVTASVFAQENGYDTCLLLNESKHLVEAIHGNVFLIFENRIVTPSITEGCLKGIVRKKLIEILEKHPDYTLEERAVSPFELKKADEVFITNSIIDIQAVTQYRKKTYRTEVGEKLGKLLKTSYLI